MGLAGSDGTSGYREVKVLLVLNPALDHMDHKHKGNELTNLDTQILEEFRIRCKYSALGPTLPVYVGQRRCKTAPCGVNAGAQACRARLTTGH